MLLSKFNRKGKICAFIGIWTAAFGIAFNRSIGISDIPDLLASFSIPLIVIGILLLILSNFFKRNRAE
ncbi:hypothetical protein GCM10009001_30510 [Virgibacillus siamensis]|uniref:Uncharacterized protein n=1 Tax=Virgibacillus siamensis TaxID=480071 RepID=A0ABP3RIB8_9BACI